MAATDGTGRGGAGRADRCRRGSRRSSDKVGGGDHGVPGGSNVQLDEQQSPSSRLPSSLSGAVTMVSPPRRLAGAARRAAVAPTSVLPSSHCSPAERRRCRRRWRAVAVAAVPVRAVAVVALLRRLDGAVPAVLLQQHRVHRRRTADQESVRPSSFNSAAANSIGKSATPQMLWRRSAAGTVAEATSSPSLRTGPIARPWMRRRGGHRHRRPASTRSETPRAPRIAPTARTPRCRRRAARPPNERE